MNERISAPNIPETQPFSRLESDGLPDQYEWIDYALYSEIEITSDSPKSPMDDLAPIPLDARNVSILDERVSGGPSGERESTPYLKERQLLISTRLEDVYRRYNLPDSYRQLMEYELHHQFINPLQKSLQRRDRMDQCMGGIDFVHESIAEVIRNVRGGTASITQSLELLAMLPELESLEVMRQTEPLNQGAMHRGDRDFTKDLIKHAHDTDGFKCVRVPTDEKNRSARPKRTPSGITVLKSKEADIYMAGVHLELIGRHTFILLPPELEGVPQRIIQDENTGLSYNAQPLSASKYIRIARV